MASEEINLRYTSSYVCINNRFLHKKYILRLDFFIFDTHAVYPVYVLCNDYSFFSDNLYNKERN